MSDWLMWPLLLVLLFVAIGGGTVATASALAACHPAATWPQTHRAAVKAGVFGATAVVAALVLIRIWP